MNAIDAIKDREVLEGHLASLLEVESLLSPEEATMACYWQAYFNLVDGDYEAAIRGFTKVINSNPPRDPAYNIEAYTCRAYAFSGHGDFDSALESWTTMIRLSPRNLQFYIQRGYTWHKKGKYTQAIEDYSEAIKISPEDPVAYSVRGDAWRLSGKLDEALQDYNSAIQWGPNEGSYYLERGNLYVLRKQPAKAQADFSKAKNLDSKVQGGAARGQSQDSEFKRP